MYKSSNANIIFHILIVKTVNIKKYSESKPDQPVKYLHTHVLDIDTSSKIGAKWLYWLVWYWFTGLHNF